MKKRRKFSAEFKARVVLELIAGEKGLMQASRAYELIAEGFNHDLKTFTGSIKELSGIGDKAIVVYLVRGWHTSTDLAFVHCNAVMWIRMIDVSEDEITAYAKRLDGRLAPVVCR